MSVVTLSSKKLFSSKNLFLSKTLFLRKNLFLSQNLFLSKNSFLSQPPFWSNPLLSEKLLSKKIPGCNFWRQCTSSIAKQTSNEDVLDLEDDIKQLKINEREAILKPLDEDISFIGPYVRPTFNFAAYINKSETLQNLLKLGVDLHKIEKKKDAPEFIMRLHFDDMKPHIFFLNDYGVNSNLIGDYLTKNPFIFQEDLETLQVRINYLQSKKFSDNMIVEIITGNPYWLMFSTQRIDTRLGHFQKTFSLTGNEVRKLAAKSPKLITYNMQHVKLSTFSIKEEMGFTDDEIKGLLLKIPKFWMLSQKSIVGRFEYVHKTMNISQEQILQMPKILLCRKFRIEQRHKFLEKLGRAQYDPKKERYVSLDQLVGGTDVQFCADVAKTSVQIYNTYLKTL